MHLDYGTGYYFNKSILNKTAALIKAAVLFYTINHFKDLQMQFLFFASNLFQSFSVQLKSYS